MNLSSTIKSIQDIMRKDAGVDGDAQRIGQLTWMLFLKVFDQREEEWEDDARDNKASYVSPIPDGLRWCDWAEPVKDAQGKKQPSMPASELIDFVNNTLFPGLQAINPALGKKHKVIHEVFRDSYNYMKSGQLMQEVIEKLDDAIDFHDFKTRANLGDVYEQMLNDLRGAGNAGEFYTPRAITQFMVQMVNPRLDKREKVLDPACGTGGFLTAAIDHFNHQITDKSGTDDKKAIEELIFGFEKKPLPHLLCTTNLLLHGIDAPSQIEHRNTLARAWNDWSKAEKMDCIVTNPPFGGYEEDAVGGTYPADLRTRETADMFMALIVKKLLKDDGGRAAVVLPDGFMFGDGIKGKLKERLLKECKLHTIVRLPKGVFAPYTTIKTNLLFFTRRKPETDDDDQDESFKTDTIWFYEHPYPPGYKSYSKTKPIRLEEFDAEKAWWGTEDNDFADREETGLAWKFDFKTLQAEKWAEAKPHWDKAEDFNNQANALESEARDLRKSLVGSTDADYRKQIETQIEELKAKAEPLRLKARDAQAAGDRIYWPIFNLDQKNPNAPEEESHDPDILLGKYKKLLGEIEETENTLKGELAAALAHHFAEEEAA
ncbi:class I SAM-dependent DNA methyltransferase [Candidatus Thiothrix sp. Deng01]|uniref:site-specific DNA-methyltransferase (adenine-specific) n=1 Tax=Candidatus Thiothrix phosphatis TaxID=3112415 RepID=A0ABU6D2N0_9GAMM|nr:class I SAM-dependent DNA methyltransferase [Candidatus Thiothrix sp. Deng01]MEB4592612.1 class I SAM-dependent DNA methyltransferase [Candidatus Thiothrix sp. Deng01]